MTDAHKVLCIPRNDTSSLPVREALQRWSALPPDPIYTAIEACRNARRCFEWACAEADTLSENSYVSVDRMSGFIDHLWLSECDSYGEFAETVPTTAAGVLAMIAFADEALERNPDAFDKAEMHSTLATAVKQMRRSLS